MFFVVYLGVMKREKIMKTMKFRTLENPTETVTVNGVEIVPDEVVEVTLMEDAEADYWEQKAELHFEK